MRIPSAGPKEICDGVYLVGSTLRSSVFDSAVYAVLGDGGEVALVDCGSPFGLSGVEDNLRKIGTCYEEVVCVLATHSHYDHVGGIAALKRLHPHIQFAIHEDDAPAVQTGDADLTCAGWMFDEEVEPCDPDRLLAEGDIVNAAGFDFEILSMPGHSPGSVAIVIETGGGRCVFTGDCYVPSCDLVGYDYDDLAETWRRLLELEPDHVCPGHYDHHYTHPVVRAMTGRPGAGIIRGFLLNPDLARMPSDLGTRIYRNGKVPRWMKQLYPQP